MGPDDAENPQNWPMWKRVYHTIPPALFGFAITFGSSVYTPAYKEIAERFDVSPTASLLGVTLYVIGLGLGPMIASPLSETFGRHIVYRISLPISALFTLGAGFSSSFGSLLVCRFFAGATGSPVLAVGAGTLADMFPPRIRARATSSFLMSPFLGPSIGPFLGGFVAQYKTWRWTNWVTLFILVVCYASSLGMQETYKKIILQKRAKRLNIAPPKQALPQGLVGVKFLLTVTLLRPLTMLFTEPIVAFMSLYNAFTFSILFAFFEAFPMVFGGIYGFSVSQVGLAFLAVAIGVIFAVATAIMLDIKVFQKQFRKAVAEGRAAVAPEHRLYSAMLGSFGITIGLFWFAWTSRRAVHWIVPIIATIPFAWGNTSIFISAALYLVDVYGPLNGASAMAANGLLRYGMSAVFPLFTVQMYKTLTIPWASSLLGFLSLLMLPIPFVLFRFGPKIREKSRYDTIKA
ncbi:uncharacterized protein PV09_00779 [Verruconis gallopava]|uniref:Major facilitator superfamily (MFS) profile domain-containing protein n=1 Tax=Verruconis gallopava TaxID=253628 RepID=A0A0D2BBU8_9PEZI|nr:uncharacterized protein PV09_00779 [Verruconis gallopava]KIW08854.1 hypothetical protein PV09_00779 [Verruconis gallopava]